MSGLGTSPPAVSASAVSPAAVMAQFVDYTSEMQMHLQRKAPQLGADCRNLWRFQDDSSIAAPFFARVILRNVQDECSSIELPLSNECGTKKAAKHNAAMKALEWLREHDQDLFFEEGGIVLRRGGRGGGGGNGGGSGGRAATTGGETAAAPEPGGQHYTSQMQILLQRKFPHVDCRSLWRFQNDTNIAAPFSTRVIVGAVELPLSNECGTKKAAKHNAAMKALEWLREHDQDLFFEEGGILTAVEGEGGSGGHTVARGGGRTSYGEGAGARGGSSGGSNTGTNGSGAESRGGAALPVALSPTDSLSCPGSSSSADSADDGSQSDELLLYQGGSDEESELFGEFHPRDYQLEAARTAIAQNTIVNMETGRGKTLIAAMVAQRYLSQYPTKKVLFVVPTVALVSQQTAYLSRCCTVPTGSAGSETRPIRVACCAGSETEGWSREDWDDFMVMNEAFVGTPEVFRRALVDQGYLSLDFCSLIIFDECHNATGNSPMAAIMRDSVRGNFYSLGGVVLPRILGLTASFINGQMKGIVKKREDLERLLQSNIISPFVLPDERKTYEAVPFARETKDITALKSAVKDYIRDALSSIPAYRRLVVKEKDCNRVLEQGFRLYVSLGSSGFHYWLRVGLIRQLWAKSETLVGNTDEKALCLSVAIRQALEPYAGALATPTPDPNSMAQTPPMPPEIRDPEFTQKLLALMRLLLELYCSLGSKFRGIVFVKEVSTTYPMAWLVNKFFRPASPHDIWPMLPCSGCSTMLNSTREENLYKFKSGEVPLLVSTNALEEGVDVAECEFVIFFDEISTTKSHIQGSGRARSKWANIYYFENDPATECLKAAQLDAAAKDKSLNVSIARMQDALLEHMRRREVGAAVRYPFTPSRNETDIACKSEVNIFNCVQILYSYVQKVMGATVSPLDSLFQWKSSSDGSTPYLSSLSYPSPTGVCTVTWGNVHDFWGTVELNDIEPEERTKNWTNNSIEIRRMVYVAVVKMHEDKILTACNDPTDKAIRECKSKCPAYEGSSSSHVEAKFLPEDLKLF